MKKQFTLLAVMLFCVSQAWGQGNWDGKPDARWAADYSSKGGAQVYEISQPAELAQLAELVNAGKSFDKKTIVLTADIDLNNQPWEPIGVMNGMFRGSFDGQGHTISGLYIPAGKEFSGLFGMISGNASIANLALGEGKIEVDATGINSVGAIVSSIYTFGKNTITIDNCHNNGTNIEANGDQVLIAGGLIGYIHSDGNVVLTNSSSNAAIKTSSKSLYVNMGGLVGTANSYNNLTITNSYSNASLTAYLGCIGGLAGGMQTFDLGQMTVSNNYATGTITAGENTRAGGLAGGINQGINGKVADNAAAITDCLVAMEGINGGSKTAGRIYGEFRVNSTKTTYPAGFLANNYAWMAQFKAAEVGADTQNGADWDGTMTADPVANWANFAVWNVDQSNKNMPSLVSYDEKITANGKAVLNPYRKVAVATTAEERIAGYLGDGSFRIYTSPGTIRIDTSDDATASILSMSGQTVAAQQLKRGTTSFSVTPGVYAVSINGESVKIIIR